MLGVFCFNRFSAYRRDVSNHIIYRYFLASFFVSAALLVYGLPVLFTTDSPTISIFGSVALILNAIGFSHFFLIALYGWLSPGRYVLVKHIIYAFISILTFCLIIDIPASFVDSYGIIHWRFGVFIGLLAALHMDMAFAANVYVIVRHFYRLKKLSVFNSIALIITFVLAGIAGSYLYVGDTVLGLSLASVGLYLGIAVVFSSVIRGTISRFLEW
jgi:hypothetical protein